jgi:hypothetical protein
MQDIALSLAMFMVIALPVGAWALLRRGGSRKQAMLMCVMAAVLAANVAIWVIPTKDGATLSGQAPR